MKLYSVYKIENTRTEKVYIGKGYVNPFTRLRSHLNHLIKGSHFNKEMQRDFNDGHISDWTFSVIDSGLTKHQAAVIENEGICRYKAFDGYNTRRSNNSQLHKHQQIVEMIKQGKKYHEIHKRLNVSLGTISNCKKNYIENRGF